MECCNLINKELRIPKKCCRLISNKRYVCLVSESWIKCLRSRRLTQPDGNVYQTISEGEANILLAPSYNKVSKPWARVSVKVIEKDEKDTYSLIEEKLCLGDQSSTFTELLGLLSQESYSLQHSAARSRYRHAGLPHREEKPQQTKPFNDVIRTALLRVLQCPLLPLTTTTGGSIATAPPPPPPSPPTRHPNIMPGIAIVESSLAFYVVQPYAPYTLWDSAVFSPAMMENSHAKLLFVLYQILQGVRFCHGHGVSVGDLRLADVFVDSKLWVQLCQPHVSRLHTDTLSSLMHRETESNNEKEVHPSTTNTQDKDCSNYTANDLPKLVQQWAYGEITNFDYLMALNHLAGRRMGDPNHHPILPWVVDFTEENGGFRDLTMSKYRLNKGDAQLDLTFESSAPFMMDTDQHGDPMHTPHHISDMLSDITYFVYKARRIPKTVLCSHVRSKWVPNEYPSSMQRLQEWTPDECIPEFFTDPDIFRSIHEDLGDLEIPSWCDSADDFVRWHMSVLEGEEVTRQLHHWIDLTFGYKLSGSAAVRSKNVVLQLVDRHGWLVNHGVVQLFTAPHPARITAHATPHSYSRSRAQNHSSPSKASSNNGPDMIVLPRGYEPLRLLEQVESLLEFCVKTTKQLPPPHTHKACGVVSPWRGLLSGRDLQAVSVLVVEAALSPRCRGLPRDATLATRASLARSLWRTHRHEIPRPLQRVVELLLRPSEAWSPGAAEEDTLGCLFTYPPAGPDGLPPPTVDMLLHPGFGYVPFPPYMASLYVVLQRMKCVDAAISQTFSTTDHNLMERALKMKKLAKEKVTIFAKYLSKRAAELGPEGLDIVMPYVRELFEDAATAVQAAWSLFNPVAAALGPRRAARAFLPLLTAILDDESTTPKHMKLYHRSYVIQLIVRLGMDTFLHSFSTLLVEASAGYKNFMGDNLDRQISTEADMDEENTVTDVFMDGGKNEMFTSSDEQDKEQNTSTSSRTQGGDEDLFPGGGMDGVGGEEGGSDPPRTDHRQQQADTASLMMEEDDRRSVSSTDPGEDALGKSVGGISVHSVSRLLEAEKRRVHGQSESDEDDNGGVGENVDDDLAGSKNETTGNSLRCAKSEQEEFSKSIMDQPGGLEYNINDVAAETIKWLSHRLGPVLTAKHLSRNLLRMLALCYLGDEQLEIITRDTPPVSAAVAAVTTTDKAVVGDTHAAHVLDCLACIAVLYGEQFVLLQYFTHLKQLIVAAQKKLTLRAEAGLVCSMVLLIHILPYLSDSTLMDILEEVIIRDLILPLLQLLSSVCVSFPSGAKARSVLCYKLIDALYLISLRIGREMIREEKMTLVLQKFFAAFNKVYCDEKDAETAQQQQQQQNPVLSQQATEERKTKEESNERLYFEMKIDSSTNEYRIGTEAVKADEKRTHRRHGSNSSLKQYSLSPTSDNKGGAASERCEDSGAAVAPGDVRQELRDTFTPEMAHLAYIPFCRLAGGIFMEEHLVNDDLIRQLCASHDLDLAQQQRADDTIPGPTFVSQSSFDGDEEVAGSFGTGVVAGNKILVAEPPVSDSAAAAVKRMSDAATAATVDYSQLYSGEMELNRQRHLRGNWLAYWEHEVGLSDHQADAFNFKQIRLQSFSGHTNSVRSLYVLDNENSFISASKDKTVKLWSLRSSGDGNGRVACQWNYAHKKSVFSVTFIESLRLAASCDGTVHLWDPFMGVCVRQIESPGAAVTVVTAMPAPLSAVVTAATDAAVRVVDVRTGKFMYDLKCTTGPAGMVRCVAVSPGGLWVAVGYTSGIVSVLDTRTGMLLATWKAHEGEVLQIKARDDKHFVTSSIDQTLVMWNHNDGKQVLNYKGLTEPVHCFNFYGNQVVSATTANRISVHSSLDNTMQAPGSLQSSARLKTDVFGRGVLTTVAVLPLNRLLLLAADTGVIRLVA